MRVDVSLTPEQGRRIYQQSIREQVTQSDVIRRAVAHYYGMPHEALPKRRAKGRTVAEQLKRVPDHIPAGVVAG